MRERIYRSFVARILLMALLSLGVGAIQTSPVSAAGSTPQSIYPPTILSYASAPSTVSAPSDASSGLPVSISVSSSPTGACSVNGQRVTFTALGTCYIHYSQPGDDTYAAAAELTVPILIYAIATTFVGSTSLEMKILDSPVQAPVASSSGEPIQFILLTVPSQASRCSVSSTGLITPLAVGDCTIRMDVGNSGSYVASSTNFYVRIVKARQAPLNLVAPTRIDPSSQATIQVTGGSGTGAVSLTSSGDCTVSGMTVTSAGLGTSCTIFATKASDSTYSEASISRAINVAYAPAAPPESSSSNGNSGDITFILDEVATKLLKPSLDAKDVQSTTGGLMVFKGRNLLSVEKVFIGDSLPVKIVKSTDAEIELELPKASLVGLQTIKLMTSVGEKSYEQAVNYLAAPTVLKPVTKILKGFKANQTSLTKSQKAALKAFVKSVGKYKLVECRGVTKTIYMTCKYLKTIYKAGRVKVTKQNLKATSPAAKQVRLVFSR